MMHARNIQHVVGKPMNVATARIRAQVAYEILAEIAERADPSTGDPVIRVARAAKTDMDRIPEFTISLRKATPGTILGRWHVCRKAFVSTKQLAKAARGTPDSRWSEAILLLLDSIIATLSVKEADYSTCVSGLQKRLRTEIGKLI